MLEKAGKFFNPKASTAKPNPNAGKVAIYFVYPDKPPSLPSPHEKLKALIAQKQFKKKYHLHGISYDRVTNTQGLLKVAADLSANIVSNKYYKVILIGFSQGGLVCAHVAETEAIKPRILSVLAVKTYFTQLDDSQEIQDIHKPLLLESNDVENFDFLSKLDEEISKSSLSYYFIVDVEDAEVLKEPNCHNSRYVEKQPEALLKIKSVVGCFNEIKKILEQPMIKASEEIKPTENYCEPVLEKSRIFTGTIEVTHENFSEGNKPLLMEKVIKGKMDESLRTARFTWLCPERTIKVRDNYKADLFSLS